MAVAEAISGPFGFRFDGIDSLPGPPPYPEAPRYWSFRRRLEAAVRPGPVPGLGNPRWPAAALPALLAIVGLTDLTINAWGYVAEAEGVQSPGGGRDANAKDRETDAMVRAARDGGDRSSVFTHEEWEEWERVAEARRAWRAAHHDYAYEAGLSLVVRGRNPICREGL